MPWPPERNDPCWCGSGRKYKQCCRPRGFAPPPELQAGGDAFPRGSHRPR
ncbi:SEC-C metal-binding domain-containing protein [Planomonospora parontospora]